MLVLRRNLPNIGAALISDGKKPNALGELKYGSSKGILRYKLGWTVANYGRRCGFGTMSIDSGAWFLGSGLSFLSLSSCAIVGTLTAFFGSQLSQLWNKNNINTFPTTNFNLLLKLLNK